MKYTMEEFRAARKRFHDLEDEIRRARATLKKMALSIDCEWRRLPKYPDYEVSEFGDVRRINAIRHIRAGYINGARTWSGYRMFDLSNDAGRDKILAHRLVCEAWHGPPPIDKPYVAHGNGIRGDNHYSNLRWASPAENAADREVHKTNTHGERNGCAKLSWPKVKRIRHLHFEEGFSKDDLAQQFGVTETSIRRILSRQSWREEHEQEGVA